MSDIEDAIKAGERNRDTAILVRNYCAHARVEKFGGTGMVEMATGLPIGHHSMRCDYAPEGGMASWDLRDAVIDYYDSNCAGCAHRKPVRLPNILEIIGERDRERAARNARDEAAARKEATALASREEVRAKLRSALGSVAQTLLDDIGAYDADRSRENFERVTQSARLAPEHFTQGLIQYVIDLARSEFWFDEAALIILDAVGGGDDQIADLAVVMLGRGHSEKVAAEKLLPRLSQISADVVPQILGATIDLAAPDRDFFLGDDSAWRREPQLLEALFGLFRSPVLSAMEQMLLSGLRYELERAGRGIQVLQAVDSAAAHPILRTLTSIYVRAPTLVQNLERENDRLPALASALNNAFDHAPDEVDGVLQELINGAPTAQRARIMRVYALALHVGYDDPPVAAGSSRHDLALSRLVWAATTERDDKVLEEVGSAFRAGPRGLTEVIRAQLDSFIGALFLMADRLVEFDDAAKERSENWLTVMERNTRRTVMRSLMESYVEWASAAANGDARSVAKIIEMFGEIPEDRDTLRCILLGATKELAKDVAGLQLLLPHLYSALVGTSVLGRSYAATAVGDLPYSSRNNIPDLLFEAFSMLLWDQYVAVHKAAVRAFQRSIVPEPYRIRAAQALLTLVRYYRTQSNEDAFLAECVSLLAGMADLFGNNRGTIRQYLINVAMDIQPVYLRSDIRSLAHTLGEESAFAKLVARMLPEVADRYNRSDDGLNLLHKVTPEGLKEHAQAFHEAAVAVLNEELRTALGVVEAFLLAGMSEEADRLIVALLAETGDTVRVRRRRTLLTWPQLAVRFERAIAAADGAQIAAVGEEWKAAVAADTRDEEDGRERRARSSLPF